MGIANLTGALAKLGRAQEHFDTMDCEIETFRLDKAHTANITFKSKKSWYVAYINPLPVVPLRIALIAGDGLNNTRAALDHLVWQLVLRENDTPQKVNCFPIYTNERLFIKDVENPLKQMVKGGRPSPLRGIPFDGDAWALIKKAQPFCSVKPQHHPLALLEKLTNFDKHRTLLVQETWLEETWLDRETLAENFWWKPELQPIERRFMVTELLPEQPTEMARFLFPRGVTPHVNVKGNIVFHPSVGDGETYIPLTTLHAILLHVTELFEKFAALPGIQA